MITKADKPKKKRIITAGNTSRNRVVVFVFCVGISAFLWIIIKLTREYEVVIQYPFSFKNVPAERVVESCSDTTLFLTIRTQGFNVLYIRYLKKQEPLLLNLKYIKNLHKDATQEIVFPTVNYTDVLSAQLKFKNQITAVSPERITVKLNKLYRKKLPIVASLDLSFAEQFMQCGKAVVSPDSVMVYGPKGIMDTLSNIKTEKYKATGLKENTNVRLRVKLPGRNVSLNASVFEVIVSIPIEKFTEKDIEVPLIVRNKPKNMDVKTFPDKIKISCFVALKDFNNVRPDMFSGSVDFKDSHDGSINMLNVRVDEYPQYVKISRFSPVRVEYIIMK